jgi:hypothetical protein
MQPYFAVHHPKEENPPAFDFWRWRLERRFTIDYLLALVDGGVDADAGRLLNEAANAIEDESVGETQMMELIRYLRTQGAGVVRSSTDLLVAVARVANLSAPLRREHWHLPVLEPNWERIPLHRVVFQGTANGLTVHAKLPASKRMVPDYKIHWIAPGGEEEELDIRHHCIGQHLDLAPSVWDWLFARRCTLLCASGSRPWPSGEASPLWLADGAEIRPL